MFTVGGAVLTVGGAELTVGIIYYCLEWDSTPLLFLIWLFTEPDIKADSPV